MGGLALGAERSDRKRKVMESSFSRSLKHATLRYGVRDLLVYEAFRPSEALLVYEAFRPSEALKMSRSVMALNMPRSVMG